MKTRVTILCDNCVSGSGFVGEHGFSALVERGSHPDLLDTGPGMSLAPNLKKLGRGLHGIRTVFISHGHYDHTGGLRWVVEQTRGIDVVAHPDIFSRHMIADPGSTGVEPRFIGCPFTQKELEDLGARFRFLDHTQEVHPGIWFITGIPRREEFAATDRRLVLQEAAGCRTDPIADDASLLVQTDGAPVLVLGCSHSGVLNILHFISEGMGIRKLRAVLGGTHLMFYGIENLAILIEELEGFSPEAVGVSHCTGFDASARLAAHFGNRFFRAGAGSGFEF